MKAVSETKPLRDIAKAIGRSEGACYQRSALLLSADDVKQGERFCRQCKRKLPESLLTITEIDKISTKCHNCREEDNQV